MKAYRFTIKTLGAFGTPLVGDSLFGQMCWGIVNHYGKQHLENLLQGYDAQRPFLVVSDALPSGYIPLPNLPSSFWQKDESQDRKALKKKQWIAVEETKQAVAFWQKSAVKEAEIISKKRDERYYNTISRDSLMATPFSNEQIWFADNALLDVIMVLDETRFSLSECQQIFSQMGLLGFGRDASIGLGRFEVVEVQPFDYPTPAKANSYLTLANSAPQQIGLDKNRSFYQITTRFGRHGDRMAISANPFKKPIILAKLGAVLTPNKWQEVLFLGRGLTDISYAQPEAVHQGYAPVLPLAIDFEEA